MIQHILSLGPLYIIAFIAVISIVVFVHEFGHYWVARRCGVKIEVFSIGFGREIFGWNDKNGTRWKVSWLPLGGYVKMYGDATGASTPANDVYSMTTEQKRVAFFHQSVDKRMAVVVAGPATNYLFAVVVLAFLFMFQGQPYSLPDIKTVVPDSVAARAGLEAGDRVISLDGSKVERFEDIQRTIALNAGTPVEMRVMRGGTEVNLSVTPQIVTTTDHFGGEHKVGRIGITSGTVEYKKWPPLQAFGAALTDTWNITAGTLRAIGQMVAGSRGTEELGGPLRIAEMAGNVAKDGIVPLISLMAYLSINLGLINLFPIPLLDGGHLMFYAYERVRGKPASESWHEIGMRVGIILVVSLMVFTFWNDLFMHFKIVSLIRSLLS